MPNIKGPHSPMFDIRAFRIFFIWPFHLWPWLNDLQNLISSSTPIRDCLCKVKSTIFIHLLILQLKYIRKTEAHTDRLKTLCFKSSLTVSGGIINDLNHNHQVRIFLKIQITFAKTHTLDSFVYNESGIYSVFGIVVSPMVITGNVSDI